MWFAFLVVTLGGVAVAVVGWLGLVGRLPRQRLAGIRTPYTLASDDRWRVAHRFAGPFLVFGGVAAAAAGLALLPFSLAGALPLAFEAASLVCVTGIAVLSAFAAWKVGVDGARRELGE